MKYFTKKWQQRISDTPDSARTLANEASALYKAEQAKNPISEDFEKQLDFHDARIERAVMDGNDLHLYFNHPGMNPFEYNHIVFKKARIKAKEHELQNCYFIYYEIYRHYLGYEMHMLLWYHEKNTGHGYADFTIICEDIETDKAVLATKKKK